MHSEGGRIVRLPTYLSLVLLAVVAAVSAPAEPAAAATVTASRPVAASAVAAWPTIKYGSYGSAVTYLQQRLVALHYDVGSVDGAFGYSTLHAVYAFQKVQGIGVDGVVGPTTWSKVASPYRPKPRYYHGSAAVEINLTKRVLYLTKAGAVTRIVDASPGKSSTPTPRGISRSRVGSTAGGRATSVCCGGPITSTADTPFTVPNQYRPIRPATDVCG